MRFSANTESQGPTEIRVNPKYLLYYELTYRIWYPKGLVINLVPSSKAFAYYDPSVNENQILLYFTENTRTGDEIYVEILPKNA